MIQPTPSRILAVDDSSDNLLLIETLLEDLEEYQLHCVDSGPAALESILACPPDLILLDVMMPDMDGYEVTRQIREWTNLGFIPILLLTAHRQADVAVGLDAGADDFIRKPFKVEEFMARIRSLLRLKHSIDQQEKVLRQRDDFVARLTHDLRTPLIAANRVLEFCSRGTYGNTVEEIRPHIQGVVDNNQQLLHMVNTLLEVYRHEANRKKLTRVRLDVREVLKDVTQQLTPLAEDKQINLELSCNQELLAENSQGFELMGDRIELNRVFTNLVGNAIKFTNAGSIHLRVDRQRAGQIDPDLRPEAKAEEYVVVSVTDTGVGIPPRELETIFDWFRPGAHVNSGSGLGLHLSQRIVQLHQGSIDVTSRLGEGTTFQVYLPSLTSSSLQNLSTCSEAR
ncbi:hybrid sensor histidine kinase/response regulator [Lyngbya confervoides]|uniref:histidine kinase n=1 Tax=Lyngbya confervoides BDU141951 TaxID=1574623 RepID=A0ABD4SZT9_9CYAN|nr:hybrid sensor histidine kinase/response regulator [Lyngbya confervoides]MCM1981582.1 hybrid sensor histidine kinase/response regulator [Lyngbya confervoides BDU141951]